jgi:hypothetical protein
MDLPGLMDCSPTPHNLIPYCGLHQKNPPPPSGNKNERAYIALSFLKRLSSQAISSRFLNVDDPPIAVAVRIVIIGRHVWEGRMTHTVNCECYRAAYRGGLTRFERTRS